ncbi:hypothetical protein GEMRC1_003076 [Eukaryota sp. GEM-RC1]
MITFSFPGPVPRTFLMPLILSSFSQSCTSLFNRLHIPQIYHIFIPRFFLGTIVFLSLTSISKKIRILSGSLASTLFLFICSSQFHLPFYATRLLPNTFALVFTNFAVSFLLNNKLATAFSLLGSASLILRSELLAFTGPLFLIYVIIPQPFSRTIRIATIAGIVSICSVLLSIIVDSQLWGNIHYDGSLKLLVWPEALVFFFNVVQGNSVQWGTSPFHWFFTSALPRSLGIWIVALSLVVVYWRQVLPYYKLVFSSLLFVFIYSFNQHKELRFVLYVVPVLNLLFACLIQEFIRSQCSPRIKQLKIIMVSLLVIMSFLVSFIFLFVSNEQLPRV